MASHLDPDLAHLDGDALVTELRTLSAHIDAAKARFLKLLSELVRRKLWFDWGARTPAEWVSWQCGLNPGAAREHVRVASRLDELPEVAAALSRGELSYSKVRALTRLEEIDDEAATVELARVHTAAQLERVVRETRKITREQADRIHDDRELKLVEREDGSVLVRGVLAGEEAAVLRRALESAVETLREGTTEDDEPPDGRRTPSYRQRMADALVLLADTALSAGPRPRSAPRRHEVVVHVDTATCATDDGTPIAPEVVERMCCDAGIIVSVARAGETIAVGRRTRVIPPSIRRALERRDACCRFPGCGARRWLDAHHIRHWSLGGATDLDNLVLLCHHHHTLLHEGGYGMTRRADGTQVFMSPHGIVIGDRVTGGASVAGLREANVSRGDDPHETVTMERQTGQRMDLGLSVLAMLRRSRGNA